MIMAGGAEIDALLEQIDALQELLICYRVGKNPSERLHVKLERTKLREEQVREQRATE